MIDLICSFTSIFFCLNCFKKTVFEFFFSSTLPFSVSIFLEEENFFFFFTVMVIFFSILFYSKGYMSGEKNLKRFLLLMVFFVFSMVILIFSSSFFWSFVGWDLLGLSSLLLIFFYQSSSSLKAGVLTFTMNRMGDCFFIICFFFFLTDSLNLVFLKQQDFFFLNSFFFFFTGLTKSAQIPFSTWLPAAMQAPTPVSSLVHSSTLVTAGFFLFYRFSSVWMTEVCCKFLFFISLSTAFLASSSALVEMDLKKIIAFSTLSHLGFMMMLLSLKLFKPSFFYMLMHAFFKALLFMCAGVMIHSNSNNQDIRKMKGIGLENPIISSIFCFAILSMSGFPFLTGFMSKDFALNFIFFSNYSSVFSFFISTTAFLTVLYSFRISWFILPSKKTWNEISDDSFSMIFPMMPLIFGTIFMGNVFCWIFFKPEFQIESSKFFFLVFIFMLLFFFWFFFFFEKKKNTFFNEMWFLSFLSDFFFLKSFIFFKKTKIYEDLSGVQGMFFFFLESFYFFKKSLLKKLSSFFLGNVEFFFVLVFIFTVLFF